MLRLECCYSNRCKSQSYSVVRTKTAALAAGCHTVVTKLSVPNPRCLTYFLGRVAYEHFHLSVRRFVRNTTKMAPNAALTSECVKGRYCVVIFYVLFRIISSFYYVFFGLFFVYIFLHLWTFCKIVVITQYSCRLLKV